MLDIFGNVFGRSKKANQGNGGANASSASNSAHGSEDEYVYVNENATTANNSSQPFDRSSVYPTIQLTDDMLRSNANDATLTWNSHGNRTPFSTHTRQMSSPVDNLPFVPSTSNFLIANGSFDLEHCFQVVDRVGNFLSSVHQSEYNFDIEKSVLRETFSV